MRSAPFEGLWMWQRWHRHGKLHSVLRRGRDLPCGFTATSFRGVGLLDDIRRAAYDAARTKPVFGGVRPAPLLFALDECANIAPIADLPALVSEAGGQGVQVMACFQDLSQVRDRWGAEVAEGFLSLFGTKVVLRDVADRATLEALSVAFGEYDRPTVSQSRTHGWGGRWSTTYGTERCPVLSPGDIANLPEGRALFVNGVRWSLIQLTPWYSTNPWPAVVTSSCASLEQALATASTEEVSA